MYYIVVGIDRGEDIYIVTVDKREICFNFLFDYYNCLIFN